jgi:hypothetical protein
MWCQRLQCGNQGAFSCLRCGTLVCGLHIHKVRVTDSSSLRPADICESCYQKEHNPAPPEEEGDDSCAAGLGCLLVAGIVVALIWWWVATGNLQL